MLMDPIFRFDYGDANTDGNGSFAQLTSTTDQAAAWAEFPIARAKALASMPPPIDPTTLAKILQDVTNSDDSEDPQDVAEKFAGGALAADTPPKFDLGRQACVLGREVWTDHHRVVGGQRCDRCVALHHRPGCVLARDRSIGRIDKGCESCVRTRQAERD